MNEQLSNQIYQSEATISQNVLNRRKKNQGLLLFGGVLLWTLAIVIVALGIQEVGNFGLLLRSPLPAIFPLGGILCIWLGIRSKKKDQQGMLVVTVYENGLHIKSNHESAGYLFTDIRGINYLKTDMINIVTIVIDDTKKITLEKHNVGGLDNLIAHIRLAQQKTFEQMTLEDIKNQTIHFDRHVIMENGIIRTKKKEVPLETVVKIEFQSDGTGGGDWHLIDANKKSRILLTEGGVMNLDLLHHFISSPSNSKQEDTRQEDSQQEENVDITFLQSDKIKKFESENILTPDQERDLAFAAILIIASSESPKTFATSYNFVERKLMKKMLKDSWGITNNASAIENLNYLSIAEGHTLFADDLYQVYTKKSDVFTIAHSEAIIERASSFAAEPTDEALFEEMQAMTNSGGENFVKMVDLLKELDYTEEELKNIKTLAAWDYGRTGHIARVACHSGYIEESVAWEYIKEGANMARENYGSWREFLAAYVLGRAVAYDASDDFVNVYRYLLFDENSPYQKHKF